MNAQLANWTPGGSTNFPTNSSGQINGFCRITQMKFHPTDPNKIYAVTAEGGFFVTTDAGTNWTVKQGTEFLTGSCASLCIDYTNDQVIYLGSGDPNYYSNGQGIYKSTDGGNTFTATSLTNCLVDEILQDPSNPTTFIAITNKGIYKSTDNAVTWVAKTSTTIPFCDLKQNAAYSPTLYACTKENTCRLFRSTDFGDTWTQITSGITTAVNFIQSGGRIGLTPADTNIVYFEAIGGGGILHKSTDGGLTFTVTKPEGAGTVSLPYITFYDYNNNNGLNGQGNYNNCICVDASDPSKVWIQAHNTWLSTDAGATWTEITHWSTKLHTDMHQLQQSPFDASKLYSCNDGGVWLSTDGGNNWTPKSNGLYAYEIANGAGKSSHTNKDYVIIGTQDNGKIYRKSNGWFTIGGGDDYENKEYDYLPNGGYFYNKDHNTRTAAPGGSTSTYGLPSSKTKWQAIGFNRTNPDVSFLGDTNIYRTTNLSATTPSWTQISTFSKTIMAVHSCIADLNRLYVITNNQRIYVSTDAMSASPSFTEYTLPSASNSLASIVAIANNADAVYISINDKVYYSSNGGVSWTNITYNLPSVNHRRILAEEYGGAEELVFIATNNAVYYKKAGQTTWTNYSTNLPGRRAPTDFSMFDNGTAQSVLRFATYGRAIWQTPFNNLRGLSAGIDVSQNLYCSNASPIPFTDISTGNITSWSWTFPGGTPSTSTLQNPSITYANPGLYGATLTVSDGMTTSTIAKSNLVLVMSSAPTSITGCTISSNSNLGNGFGIGIRLFALGSISNATSGNNGQYSDFTCSTWAILTQGNTYNATVTTGTTNAEGARVYIDYNDNGIFEISESVISYPSNNSGTRTLSFTIPSSGVTLNKGLRLRVLSKFNSIPSNGCDVSTYGQAEDYTVFIQPAPSAVLSNGSGASTICAGQSANVKVNIIGGTSPYTVVVSDGSANQTVINYASNTDISNVLNSSTTFTLVSVTDFFGTTIPVSGSASVTVNQNSSNTTNITNCGSYTWTCNGTNYTSSGNYTCTSYNASGCVHTETLNLTITPGSSDTVSASSCGSYTWTANSNTVYTSSGMYSYTSGCVTHYLNLTITPNTSDTISESSCGSYTWAANANIVYTTSGMYSYTNGCVTHYLNLTITPNTSDTVSASSCGSYTWTANSNTNYTTSGMYSYTSGCVTHYLNLTITPGIYVKAKAILEGPYNSTLGLMNDSLRALNLIPLTEPYSAPPYSKLPIGEMNGETMNPSVLSVTGPNAIVDWLFVEIRSASNPITVLANKRALIQRDGDIVDVDGIAPVYFSSLSGGSYFVSVKHRNHLGVMTSVPFMFNGCVGTDIDFTSIPVFVNPSINNSPRRMIGAMYTLWSGDANNNKNVKYNGLNNDKDKILTAIGAGTPNSTIQPVYRVEDLNMDGKIRYNNANNDRVIIIDNVGANTPNVIINQHTPN